VVEFELLGGVDFHDDGAVPSFYIAAMVSAIIGPAAESITIAIRNIRATKPP